MARSNPEEQMVKGRGARDRNGGGSAAKPPVDSGGSSSGTATRTDGNRGGERTAAERRRDDDDDHQRLAVPRTRDRDHDNPAVIVRQSRPAVVTVNNYGSYYRPRYYAPAYYHRWIGSYYGWSPISYAPWPWIYGAVGFSNFGFYTAFGSTYPYAPYAPYASYAPYAAGFGAIRLKVQPRDAQVFVDGNYAGIVDDFDGTFQSLRVQPGGHKIEIHMPGYEDLDLDVHVQPGKTITLQETLRPRP